MKNAIEGTGWNNTKGTGKGTAIAISNEEQSMDYKKVQFRAQLHNYSKEWVDGKWYNKDNSQTYKPLGSWKKNGTEWMYVDESGWYPKDCWQKIDFKWYFFDRKGHMLKDAYQKDTAGKICYLTKSGAWDEKAAVIGWEKDAKGYAAASIKKHIKNFIKMTKVEN